MCGWLYIYIVSSCVLWIGCMWTMMIERLTLLPVWSLNCLFVSMINDICSKSVAMISNTSIAWYWYILIWVALRMHNSCFSHDAHVCMCIFYIVHARTVMTVITVLTGRPGRITTATHIMIASYTYYDYMISARSQPPSQPMYDMPEHCKLPGVCNCNQHTHTPTHYY
jgi:hypothetical protein